MHQRFYRVAFAIARHIAVERGANHEQALQRDHPPRPAVQSLGGEGDDPAQVRRARGQDSGGEGQAHG